MISPEQRRARRNYLGSSDAAAVVGKDPWKTPYELWLEKTGQLEETDEPPSPAAELGNYLEPALLDWAAQQLGAPVERDIFLVHGNGLLSANLDGLSLHAEPPCVVEAKTVGLLGGTAADAWGDAESDAVPDHVALQAAHQLAVVNTASGSGEDVGWVLVPALLARRGFVMFRVQRDRDLEDALVEAELRWWTDYVSRGTPPPPEPSPALAVLKRLRRTPGKTVPVDAALIVAREAARAHRLEAEKLDQNAQAALILALGDAENGEAISLPVNGQHPTRFFVTYRATERKGYSVAAATVRTLRTGSAPGLSPKEIA